MPINVLDQETVNKLPRLSEIHEFYGVEVNAIAVDELFDLYERTGFLYPEKAVRLRPYLDQVRKNWEWMLRGGESLLYVLTSGDTHSGRAALAVWRTTHRGWTYQHLVSENNPYASRAVMLAAEAAMILKGSDESAENWFRPENRFPARVFGSMIEAIGGSLSSTQDHAYCAISREMPLPAAGAISVRAYDPSRLADLCSLGMAARGRVYIAAEELATDVSLKSIDLLYRRVGLSRTRSVWMAYANGKPLGAALVYRGPLGLNFSFLENRTELLLAPSLSDIQIEGVVAALLAAAVACYGDFELEHIPVICNDAEVSSLVRMGGQFLRHYNRCIWLKDAYARAYRHVDNFYSKILQRADKRRRKPLFAIETSQ
jgi:hypothetical protein